MKNVQKWNDCVLSSVDKTHSSLQKFCKFFFGPESFPNNRESTPPTDNNQENTRNTCEDRNKLAMDKL